MGARADNIPVEVIQRAFADSGLSQNEVARRMGWVRSPTPNTDRVRRALGIKPTSGSRPKKQTSVTYERALELIDAMGLEPVDYGL